MAARVLANQAINKLHLRSLAFPHLDKDAIPKKQQARNATLQVTGTRDFQQMLETPLRHGQLVGRVWGIA